MERREGSEYIGCTPATHYRRQNITSDVVDHRHHLSMLMSLYRQHHTRKKGVVALCADAWSGRPFQHYLELSEDSDSTIVAELQCFQLICQRMADAADEATHTSALCDIGAAMDLMATAPRVAADVMVVASFTQQLLCRLEDKWQQYLDHDRRLLRASSYSPFHPSLRTHPFYSSLPPVPTDPYFVIRFQPSHVWFMRCSILSSPRSVTRP